MTIANIEKDPVQTQSKPQANWIARGQEIIQTEIEGLTQLANQLDQAFNTAIGILLNCKGRVVVTGMGKSGLVGKKIAATLSSTGTPSFFLHPAEGSHGDLGMVLKNDCVIAISNSGESPEILDIIPVLKRIGIPIIALTAKTKSTLAKHSAVVLNISVPKEACSLGLAPTTSTTATLALGDALSVVLLEEKGFSQNDFALFHPGGALGKRLLLKVQDVMHQGENLPLVKLDTPFTETLITVSEKKLGLVLVTTDDGRLAGLLTDGDIRRSLVRFDNPAETPLAAMMTGNPKLISPEAMAVEALNIMETSKISALICCDNAHRPVGVVHLHDLLKCGLV
ncbi:MAG: KpsF/GutQ family sugar-phosphate isomerase [Cyanobacteria bacterium P01_H01_bin.74]